MDDTDIQILQAVEGIAGDQYPREITFDQLTQAAQPDDMDPVEFGQRINTLIRKNMIAIDYTPIIRGLRPDGLRAIGEWPERLARQRR